MNKAKSICTHPGCNTLISGSGRCEKHKFDNFKRLDSKKTPEDKKFYSSGRWTKTSKAFRQANPLCQPCLKKGQVTASKIAHHVPDRKILIERGDDPFDWKFLEAVCFNCHQKELRKKQ